MYPYFLRPRACLIRRKDRNQIQACIVCENDQQASDEAWKLRSINKQVVKHGNYGVYEQSILAIAGQVRGKLVT